MSRTRQVSGTGPSPLARAVLPINVGRPAIPTTAPRGPLADPLFRLLLVGEALASLSEQVFIICLTLLVLDLAGPGATLGLVLAVAAVPRAVLLPIGGVLADRVAPARIVVAATWHPSQHGDHHGRGWAEHDQHGQPRQLRPGRSPAPRRLVCGRGGVPGPASWSPVRWPPRPSRCWSTSPPGSSPNPFSSGADVRMYGDAPGIRLG